MPATSPRPELRFKFGEHPELDDVSALEWLETNGLGGYACSTVCGLNTRKYHGLLAAPLSPPVNRFLFLSKLDETLVTPGGEFELGTNLYPGAVSPRGYAHLREFHLDPFPRAVFSAGGYVLEKKVFMPHGRQAVVVEYSLKNAKGRKPSEKERAGALLRARPFVAFRGEHETTRENADAATEPRAAKNYISLRLYGSLPALFIHHNGWGFVPGAHWYRNFEYPRELERGLDCREDLFSPGELVHRFENGDGLILAAVEKKPMRIDHSREIMPLETVVGTLMEKELRRRAEQARESSAAPAWARRLAASADAFVVRRGDAGTSIVAGYPWFNDWGRDAMVSLPGLLLCTNRLEDAREALVTFAAHVSEGMIPNCFSGRDEPLYNSVDASLWFVLACFEYWKRRKDDPALGEKLAPAIVDVLDHYTAGTRYGIGLHPSGLLAAGSPETQLTWMDAKAGGVVFTPRHGMAVEVNALWYNALSAAGAIMKSLGGEAVNFEAEARAAREAFNANFWNPAKECLYDVVRDDGTKDSSIRPNQVFAVSLPFELIPDDRAAKVVKCVEKHLLTPYGLRSLAREEQGYRGRYEGGVMERDGAYHNGTVWAWLIGPFITAYLKVNGRNAKTLARAKKMTAPLAEHLRAACIGHVSEIFDGDAPHAPRGCFAQAWSEAELIRVWTEIGHK
ncbi:MAG: amylo-alpha-1,6-glucosidase [bacterium]